MPVKLYVAASFSGRPAMRLVAGAERTKATQTALYKDLPRDYRFTGFELVNAIENADYVFLPQFVKRVTPAWQAYFDAVRAQAAQHGKEVILFIGGDLGYRTHIDGAICFVKSTFAHEKRGNEIVCPAYVEDLSEAHVCQPRAKQEKPVVSFCGYAGFPDIRTRMRYYAKNALLDVVAAFTLNPLLSVYKRGIYFRRRVIRTLEKSERVRTNFIVRRSFSGDTATIALDPEAARREYIENMADSDFVLAPKGDGNYSARFYEALSLGRIPILIDTDMVLPLENVIDYSKFIMRVPHTDIFRLGDIIADFYDSLTDDEFRAMQQRARDAFAQHLRYDAYFNFAFPLLKEKGLKGFA